MTGSLEVIHAIGQVFALCGIVSVRMFLPIFTYLSLMSFGRNCNWAPKFLVGMAEKLPEWLTSLPVLVIFGSLAILELAAMRNPDIKEFLTEEVDKFAKPIISLLLAFTVITSVQSDTLHTFFNCGNTLPQVTNRSVQQVSKDVKQTTSDTTQQSTAGAQQKTVDAKQPSSGITQQKNTDTPQKISTPKKADNTGIGILSSILGLIFAAIGSFITVVLCHFRKIILEKINAIDPDDSLRLQTISNYTGEILLITLLILCLIPGIALFIILGQFALMSVAKKWVDKYEKKCRHLCPHCKQAGKETLVLNSAFVCPVCGAEQSDIKCLNYFGFPGKKLLVPEFKERHRVELFSAKRCRWCAEPLKSDVKSCSACSRPQWNDEQFIKHYLQCIKARALILIGILLISLSCAFVVGIGTCISVIGCSVVLILYRPLVLRPLTIHLGVTARFWIAFFNLCFKLSFNIFLLAIAALPIAGFFIILPLIIRYLLARKKFEKHYLQILEEKN